MITKNYTGVRLNIYIEEIKLNIPGENSENNLIIVFNYGEKELF